MDQSIVPQSYIVHSTKYDGSLHYRYTTTFVGEEPGLIMLFGQAGMTLESYRGSYTTAFHMLNCYWSDRWYNLEVLWHTDWQPRLHYVNIATPATWRDQTLRFIDLDLDVIWSAATNDIILDDEDEFIAHQQRFAYPDDLITRAQQTSEAVRTMIALRHYPFDGSLYGWRPHGTT